MGGLSKLTGKTPDWMLDMGDPAGIFGFKESKQAAKDFESAEATNKVLEEEQLQAMKDEQKKNPAVSNIRI